MANEEEDAGIANISGDDAFDENELKMKELAEQKKQKEMFRPSSGKARPESAHHNLKLSDKPDAQRIYTKFSQFVESQGIMRDNFFPRENGFVGKDQFSSCFQAVGFSISSDEINSVWSDLNCDKQTTSVLEMAQFYAKLNCWRDTMEKKHDMIANLNMELLDDLDKKCQKLAVNEDVKQNAQPQFKPQSAVGIRKRILPRPFSSSSKKSDTSSRAGKLLKNKIDYLKQAKLQEEKEVSELETIIKLGKKKQEFDCLHKIREACKIAQGLGKPFTFTTATKGDAGLEIFKVEDNEMSQLTLEEFMREYKKLKREENSVTLKQGRPMTRGPQTSQMSQMPLVPQLSSPGTEIPMVSTMLTTKTQSKDSKKEKQKKLLDVLKDTMKLTQILKEQLKILEEKGVYGGEKAKK